MNNNTLIDNLDNAWAEKCAGCGTLKDNIAACANDLVNRLRMDGVDLYKLAENLVIRELQLNEVLLLNRQMTKKIEGYEPHVHKKLSIQ